MTSHRVISTKLSRCWKNQQGCWVARAEARGSALPAVTVIAGAALLFVARSARGGTFQAFINDFDGFVEAAGDVTIIDFETLPDGNPSFSGALITPEFNYTDLGVTFSSQAPRLTIIGDPEFDFSLCACPVESNDPNRNWIIADFVDPVSAVGYFFPGGSTLSAVTDVGVARVGFASSGNDFFVGIVSEDPIRRARADEGTNAESINAFVFAPIPEPGTLLLLGIGCIELVRRRIHRL